MQPNTALKNLAAKTTALRTSRGHTIGKLAGFNSCGVSESTLRRIEKAYATGYNPSLSTLVKVASTFEVPVSQLIGQIQTAKSIQVIARRS